MRIFQHPNQMLLLLRTISKHCQTSPPGPKLLQEGLWPSCPFLAPGQSLSYSQLHITRSFWMDRMRLRAASQLARLPVMMMVSELLFSAGRSILVLLSSRIYKERHNEKQLPLRHPEPRARK